MSVCSDFILTFLASKQIFSQLKIVHTPFQEIKLKLQGSTHLKALILIHTFSLFKLDFMAIQSRIENIDLRFMIFILLEKQLYKV